MFPFPGNGRKWKDSKSLGISDDLKNALFSSVARLATGSDDCTLKGTRRGASVHARQTTKSPMPRHLRRRGYTLEFSRSGPIYIFKPDLFKVKRDFYWCVRLSISMECERETIRNRLLDQRLG